MKVVFNSSVHLSNVRVIIYIFNHYLNMLLLKAVGLRVKAVCITSSYTQIQ